MNETSGPIDFVITWADTTDPLWLRKRAGFLHGGSDASTDDFVLKNQPWGTLRYLLRGIELYCPWVRYVHLVTPDQSPDWLNLEHPQLRLVNQDDLVDPEYLPTFNSNAIEMNLHKIPDLAENFVYFNDDMMIFAPTEASHFFPGGSPAGFAVMNALSGGDPLSHYLLNNVGVLNRHFDKKSTIRKAWTQWFSPKYGAKNIRNLLLLPWPAFTGFFEPHLPMALRKSTFAELWKHEPALVRQTSASKFRALDNLSPFVFRYWQLCSGDFTPVSPSQYGRFYEFGRDDIRDITSAILSGRHRLICVNDGDGQDFNAHTSLFREALEKALPTRSQFELL